MTTLSGQKGLVKHQRVPWELCCEMELPHGAQSRGSTKSNGHGFIYEGMNLFGKDKGLGSFTGLSNAVVPSVLLERHHTDVLSERFGATQYVP